MAVAAMEAPRVASARIDATRVGALVLVRLCIGEAGAGEAELTRDLQPLVSPIVEAAEWRLLVGRLLAAHIKDQLVTRKGSRLVATEAGRRQATRFLGMSTAGAGDWPEVRDSLLVAVALGMPGLPARRLKSLGKIDGLRCAIVAAAHGLKLKTSASASRLRNTLALVALDRAFGNRLHRDLGSKSGLSAKAGRLLAGQLSVRPRDYGTDGRLVAALAAEAVGVSNGTLPALRMALLRGFVTGRFEWPLTVKPHPAPEVRRDDVEPVVTTQAQAIAPTRQVAEPAVVQRLRPSPTVVGRPDPQAFAQALRELARPLATGWSGSRKVYISQLWSAVCEQRSGWGLSEIEFKAMLTEAHRTGLLALGTSDLRDKRDIEDIQASATVFKNTVWHYVRVDE